MFFFWLEKESTRNYLNQFTILRYDGTKKKEGSLCIHWIEYL